jgi:hypothetical protein
MVLMPLPPYVCLTGSLNPAVEHQPVLLCASDEGPRGTYWGGVHAGELQLLLLLLLVVVSCWEELSPSVFSWRRRLKQTLQLSLWFQKTEAVVCLFVCVCVCVCV